MRRFRKWRKVKPVSIEHYAPDLSLSAFDYVFPILPEDRLAEAEKRINSFLTQASPDHFNKGFYDAYVEKEQALLIAQLSAQRPYHDGTNDSIALKHKSELNRLQYAMRQFVYEIDSLGKEIDSLQMIYDQHNS